MSTYKNIYGTITMLQITVMVLMHHAPGARGGLIGILQKNVLGYPEFHKQQSWQFDPSVSARRAPEFIALHGFRSEKLIERIGLGMDGRQNERREQQMVRDFLYDQQQRQQEQQQKVANSGSGVHLLPQYPQSPRLQFPPSYKR